MKVVILAGGFGTRLSEETTLKPKPMVTIGGKPILWHIMKMYSSYGYNEFVILLGYKGYIIKEYFFNYFLHESDFEINLSNNNVEILNKQNLNWKVSLIDTGENTMTGGRIKKIENLIGNNTFLLTYGDGLANINLDLLLKFHKSHNKIITVTSAQPDARFGSLQINDDNKVESFQEKPKGDGSWINAGFFVCEPKVFEFIKDSEDEIFEQSPLRNLAKASELYTYKHHDFWMPMDTLRDKNKLESLWDSKLAPWKIW